jgi:hypothetical protein
MEQDFLEKLGEANLVRNFSEYIGPESSLGVYKHS